MQSEAYVNVDGFQNNSHGGVSPSPIQHQDRQAQYEEQQRQHQHQPSGASSSAGTDAMSPSSTLDDANDIEAHFGTNPTPPENLMLAGSSRSVAGRGSTDIAGTFVRVPFDSNDGSVGGGPRPAALSVVMSDLGQSRTQAPVPGQINNANLINTLNLLRAVDHSWYGVLQRGLHGGASEALDVAEAEDKDEERASSNAKGKATC